MEKNRQNFSPKFKAETTLEILREQKSMSQIAAERNVHPNQLSQWKKLALEGLPVLFEKGEGGQLQEVRAEYEKQLEQLYAEIGKLTTQLAWLEKNLADSLNRTERLELVERENSELPLSVQAELLGISRSSLYYQGVPVSPEEIRLKHRIDEIYTAWPFYGSRKIVAHLHNEGVNINRKRVQRYMREMGIAGICPGPNLSKRNLAHRLYPYLLDGVTASYPNHIWGTDLTYIRLRGGWMYLVAIIDWRVPSGCHYIVGWELDQSLEIGFVLRTVEQALAKACPLIFNSDQASHTPKGRTSPQYTELVLAAGAQVSMDGKGRAIDNIFTERFWRSLKWENVYLRDYESPKAARAGIAEYIEFYNSTRLHQSLEYHTPVQFYRGEVRPRD